MVDRTPAWFGSALVGAIFAASLAASVYHVWSHEASLLATLLGQVSLLALALAFGALGYRVLASVDTPAERTTVGVRAGAGFALAGLASAGYAAHRHLTPESAAPLDVILFQAIFVALVGASAGLLVGRERVRRARTIADLEATAADLASSEAETRREKRRFESLFRNASVAIADLRYVAGEPEVRRANDEFLELLHADGPVEGAGLFDVLDVAEAETESAVAARVADHEIHESEVSVDRGDEPGYYKLRVIPYDDGTEGEHAFALFTDVTELRRTQQRLDESVEELEASNERLEQFAYAISHDLQEPLRMIASYLRLLEDDHRDDLDDEARQFVDVAVDGAERMQAMIDSLLEYSRVTTGGAPLEPTDADAVLDDVLTDLAPKVEETDATVTSDDLPAVVADADQLGQVFRNLISNALKYSGDEPPRVHVGAERLDGEVRFSVADEGIGLRPEQRERVFDVFETVHTEAEGSESGIGLALCRRIVERHGGDIWVESEPGEGSTFSFTVPAVESERRADVGAAAVDE